MIFTVITVSTSSINTLVKVYREFEKEYRGYFKLNIIYAARELSVKKIEKMKSQILESDIILVDLMGSPESIVKDVNLCLEKTKGYIIPYGRSGREYLKLGELSADSMKMGMEKSNKKPNMKTMKKMSNMAEKMGKIMPGKMRDIRNLSQITKYFSLADKQNINNMLILLLREYGGYKNLPKPLEAKEIPQIGICDPKTKKYYNNYFEYKKAYGYDESKPIVAVLFYGHSYPNDTASCVERICNSISKFANILPIAFSSPSTNYFTKLSDILKHAAGRNADIIVNFMSFRLGAGPMGGDAKKAVDILKEIDAPYIHPFFMSRRRIKEWEQSNQGINSVEFTLSVMLPEFDGCIETLPVGAMCEPLEDKEFDIDIRELTLIEDRAEKCVSRIKKQLELRQKKNKDKKIAIICYNYPPGEANVFGGSFLDTFKSIEKLLRDLSKRGYTTKELTQQELIGIFTKEIVNSARYNSDDGAMIKYNAKLYEDRISKEPFYKELVTQWGDVPGEIMVSEEGQFLIPGIVIGNVFVGLQPSRGNYEDSEKVYHDKQLLPHHQYLAYYQWLSHEFNADAMVHVGTHGTMEFLKGKECGMSGECFPDMLVYDIPHMYLYYVGNPSEAMIAKRRSHANIISYQPPEFVKGELYGVYVKLKTLIDDYREAKLKSPVRCNEMLSAIKEEAVANNLSQDLNDLEHELFRMDRTLIPKGLHTFGIGYNYMQAVSYARGLIMYDQGEILSLNRIIAQDMGLDYDSLTDSNDVSTLEIVDKFAEKLFYSYMEDNIIDSGIIKQDKLKDHALDTLNYAKNVIENCMKNNETEGLFRTLNGRYNAAKLAGDIYRSPEVMPTGFNLYQFDPRYVPSSTAFKRGGRIAQNTLDKYKEENGEYPESTAVILWGLETSRTQGETVSQILAYLGVRSVESKNAWESRYEIIPIKELGRKRVDVVVNICGFFRDMFPNIIDDLNKVFKELHELDEPDELNPFKANSKKIYKRLIEEGMEHAKAEELSYARIFGPSEGEYGTGITSMIGTKNWTDESQIGDAFVDSIKHVYSENYRGVEAKELYKSNLESVNLVSQIRSSHEYEVTDIDHYYEFFGGLAKSVEMARGEKVKVYITDTTSHRMETEAVSKSINRGIRTRLLNPKWIDGMLEHKFHGAQMIADRFENIMGLAATTGDVEEWIYNDLHSKYIDDEDMQNRMKENNSYAYIEIMEQMIEYYKRGYWNADDEQINKLKDVILKVEGDVEDGI